jgi:glycosyltransferase involved in cell wall biosynthesis
MNQTGGFIPVAESALRNKGTFRPAVLIPVYDHELAIGPTLEAVLAHDCEVLMVDDGSGEACRDTLIELRDRHPKRVRLVRLEINSGKGAAVKTGFRALLEEGFSHAVQIDADGQHDISDLPVFLETAFSNPDSLVAGYPVFDAEIPRIRFYGRYLTHFWVWINTLSFAIRDTMCGFRVYPLASIAEILEQEKCGDRMDFDPEIIVRWYWRGGKVMNLPTRVRYPLDGISHFDVCKDNLLISQMHARLFFGMLYRLPGMLWRRAHG